MNLLMEPLWSPYLAGAGIGLLLLCSFLFSGRPLGCSSAFSRTAGMIQCHVLGKEIRNSEYYKLLPPKIEWQIMLVLGIVLGSFLSSSLSGTFELNVVPESFGSAFGYDPVLRIFTALAGGIFMGMGARWAWGCTSGHGISGFSQLSVASIAAVACFFAAGIATAMLLYAGV
jgi:uncharacterized membrane protein YedE/YeeE